MIEWKSEISLKCFCTGSREDTWNRPMVQWRYSREFLWSLFHFWHVIYHHQWNKWDSVSTMKLGDTGSWVIDWTVWNDAKSNARWLSDNWDDCPYDYKRRSPWLTSSYSDHLIRPIGVKCFHMRLLIRHSHLQSFSVRLLKALCMILAGFVDSRSKILGQNKVDSVRATGKSVIG